jgi:hypothetical protein
MVLAKRKVVAARKVTIALLSMNWLFLCTLTFITILEPQERTVSTERPAASKAAHSILPSEIYNFRKFPATTPLSHTSHDSRESQASGDVPLQSA